MADHTGAQQEGTGALRDGAPRQQGRGALGQPPRGACADAHAVVGDRGRVGADLGGGGQGAVWRAGHTCK